ncbi:hypothetical protein EV129_101745 [Rhizobium azibense]|uniref:Uncharacterized protein n=1 Tax=Rhizobium azibense TaxID=1136135 RepID=A0A4R3S194_9HYPH|nr:hypothetical protein EV129_101745 [Rhizobium azibense]
MDYNDYPRHSGLGWLTLPSSLRPSTRDAMRCCAAKMGPHKSPLPPQMQQPETVGANSKLDKT